MVQINTLTCKVVPLQPLYFFCLKLPLKLLNWCNSSLLLTIDVNTPSSLTLKADVHHSKYYLTLRTCLVPYETKNNFQGSHIILWLGLVLEWKLRNNQNIINYTSRKVHLNNKSLKEKVLKYIIDYITFVTNYI